MLKSVQLDELLSGKLSQSAARELLLGLTPDKLDATLLTQCIDQVKATCAADFLPFSQMGACVLDSSGTGGSGRPRFNTSTASSFVIAADGIPVVKFGNRKATSPSGSFDILNELGIAERISGDQTAKILQGAGLVFVFAPAVYPALSFLSPIRASLSVPTVFNFIGPLLNPVCPAYRVMGVADPVMQKLIATILRKTASNVCSLVVRSECGLDEICPCCNTTVYEVGTDKDSAYTLANESKSNTATSNQDYNPARNAALLLKILNGHDNRSSEYQLTCMNAGAGLYCAGKANSIQSGVERARQLIASGKVSEQMQKVKREYAKYS